MGYGARPDFSVNKYTARHSECRGGASLGKKKIFLETVILYHSQWAACKHFWPYFPKMLLAAIFIPKNGKEGQLWQEGIGNG